MHIPCTNNFKSLFPMDILKNYKSYDQLEKTGIKNGTYDSFWTLNDDASNSTSISTNSLINDPDELKYIDDDDEDSISSSSDEIYSLETSMIEMHGSEDENEPKDLSNDILNNNSTNKNSKKYHHSPSPMIGRANMSFYNQESFCDDAIANLTSKGFAQSINRVSFVNNLYNSHQKLKNPILHLKDSKNAQKPIVNSKIEVSVLPDRQILANEKVGDWDIDFETLDNDDLLSLSSHGSDRSNTPVDTRCECKSTQDKSSDNSQNSKLKEKQLVRPCILKFTDELDIIAQTHNSDCIDVLNSPVENGFARTEDYKNDNVDDYEEERNENVDDDDDDDDDDDNSTICEGKINEKERQEKTRRERDILAELYSENVQFYRRPNEIDRSAARRLARRLFELDGFRMTDVAKHLSKRNEFSQLVGEEFSNFFDFSAQPIDECLRKFLHKLILIGETQERERIIHHFSRRYIQCNPLMYNGEEACHNLVCALLLLNTDLHAPSAMTKKMSCDDFVMSMNSLNNGLNFDKDDLSRLFNIVLEQPFRWSFDNELVGLVQPKLDFPDLSKQMNTNHYNFYFEVPSESSSREYMSGYLLRKSIKESHDRKTSIGKRGWKLYFGRLQDLTLHLYKDEIPPPPNNTPPPIVSNTAPALSSTAPALNSKHRSSSRRRHTTNSSAPIIKDNQLAAQQHNSYSEPVLNKIGINNTTNSADGNKASLDFSSSMEPQHKKRRSLSFKLSLSLKSRSSSSQGTKKPTVQPLSPSPGLATPPVQPASPLLSSSVASSTASSSSCIILSDAQIYLNHAFASRATDYSKKRNVFRLQVSSGSEYLFQVNEQREVDLWVDCLNFVAALLSPPVLHFTNGPPTLQQQQPCHLPPLAQQSLGNTLRKKSNTTLTSLNIKEQLESHQRCVITLEQDLMHLNSAAAAAMTTQQSAPLLMTSDSSSVNPPSPITAHTPLQTQKWDRLSKNNKWQLSRQRKFVERELIRYKTYCRLLEFELIHMHNMALAAAAASQQSSGPPPPAPLFYNQQTNQFVPFVPVIQYPQQQNNGHHHSNCIKELSEDNNTSGLSPHTQQDTLAISNTTTANGCIPPPPQYFIGTTPQSQQLALHNNTQYLGGPQQQPPPNCNNNKINFQRRRFNKHHHRRSNGGGFLVQYPQPVRQQQQQQQQYNSGIINSTISANLQQPISSTPKDIQPNDIVIGNVPILNNSSSNNTNNNSITTPTLQPSTFYEIV